MDNVTIKPEELADVMGELLDTYREDVVDAVKKEVRKATRDMVSETKATAPKSELNRSGTYASHIASKKLREDYQSLVMVWYVKSPEYRLSHLLEFGHVTRDGVSRSTAYHFIGDALKSIEPQYEARVRRAISAIR